MKALLDAVPTTSGSKNKPRSDQAIEGDRDRIRDAVFGTGRPLNKFADPRMLVESPFAGVKVRQADGTIRELKPGESVDMGGLERTIPEGAPKDNEDYEVPSYEGPE